MPSTDKTSKLGLNQFIDTDKPNWTDYTEDMAKIDGGTLDKNTYDPTNVGGDAFRASNQKMTEYAKASEYTPITKTDNASSAIGKLEAGVAATGDMKKAVYDADDDGKVDNAKVADEAKSVKYAAVLDAPVSLPNPNALTIQLDGATKATYTGGKAETVNVTANAIGAASLVGGKVPSSQLDIVDATDSTEKTKVASANSVRMAKEEVVAAIPETYDAEQIEYSNPDLPDVINAKQMLDSVNEKTTLRNMLHNWYFPRPINPRGITGTFSTVGAYFIDRWKLISGTVTLTANGLVLNGTMAQILEYAVGTNVTASTKMYSETATASYNNATKTFTVTSSGGTIESAKLEQGAIPTLNNDAPPDHGLELVKCQRFQYVPPTASLYPAVLITPNQIDFMINPPTTLRIVPALVNSDGIGIYDMGGASQTGFSFSFIGTIGVIRLRATKTNHGLTNAMLQVTGLAIFDANL